MRSVHSLALGIATVAFYLVAVSGVAQTAPTKTQGDPSPTATSAVELPDSPGTTWARFEEAAQQNNPAQPAADAPTAASSAQTQTPPAQKQEQSQDQTMQRPVGTAAAEGPKVSGITAAQPAGVAIAPAKQRRVRILVLKVGAILGAGAAIGTVVALSAATPSKPPGAH